MYEEWKPVFTALVCDIMDKNGLSRAGDGQRKKIAPGHQLLTTGGYPKED